MRPLVLILSALLVLGMVSVAPATADVGTNVTPVSNIQFPTMKNVQGQDRAWSGTDSDFITFDIDPDPDVQNIRTVGVFGSIGSGGLVLDVTDGDPTELAFFECSIGQGDIQTFQQGDRTFFAFTDDGYSTERGFRNAEGEITDCLQWGATDPVFAGSNKQGTFIVEMTDPTALEIVEFVPFSRGSHNQTVDPSGNFLYNSNSELATNVLNAGIEVWEITNLGTDEPIDHGVMPLPVRPGLGTDSHDLTFNKDGSRAYSAALSQTVIINTEDLANPSVISTFMDPAINVEHQANAVTITDPLLGARDYLIIEDEFAGALGAEQTCPSGGTHVYDITGELELAPVKVGSWYITDATNTNAVGLRPCTAHVFDIHEDAAVMTMSFYGGGVKVIDLSGLVGVSLGGNGVGMKEIGSHYFTSSDDNGVSDSWSVKAAHVEIDEEGDLEFFMYSNDRNRGVDTYLFSGGRSELVNSGGSWFHGTSFLELNGPATMPDDYTPVCMLKGDSQAKAVSLLDI